MKEQSVIHRFKSCLLNVSRRGVRCVLAFIGLLVNLLLSPLACGLQETRKIKQAGLPKDKEQEVLQQLLYKETKLLQTIDGICMSDH